MSKIYMYRLFKTKEEAKKFIKKRGYGVYHNLKWELKRHRYSLCHYECSQEQLDEKGWYSVEWTEWN